jgi:hypothetical protein
MIDEEKNEIYVSKWTEDDLQLWHAPSLKPLVLNQNDIMAADARLNEYAPPTTALRLDIFSAFGR